MQVQYSAVPIIVSQTVMGMHDFLSTDEEKETLVFALSNYGYLLRSQVSSAKVHRFSFEAFSHLIKASYDVREPKHAAVVQVLDTLHIRQMEAVNAQEH